MGLKPRADKRNAATHAEYIAQVEESRRVDIRRLHDLIREVAPELEPTMAFGMMGYGPIHYKYASGREGDWFKVGLANQKRYISLYCCAADERGYVAEQFRDRLPGADIGKSCVRFKRLADLDEKVLRALIRATSRAGWGT
jgi:uncharacterized protein YdhG (YjbR/CyaY superfamily)